MIITLFKVTDSQDTVNKTLSNGFDIEVKLKSDFNIINPDVVLLIDGFDVRNYNYVSIPEFGRFYFIDSVTNLNRRMYRLTCSCDVLQTYGAEIMAATGTYQRDIKPGDFMPVSADISTYEFLTYNSSVDLVSGSSILVSTVEVQNG